MTTLDVTPNNGCRTSSNLHLSRPDTSFANGRNAAHGLDSVGTGGLHSKHRNRASVVAMLRYLLKRLMPLQRRKRRHGCRFCEPPRLHATRTGRVALEEIQH